MKLKFIPTTIFRETPKVTFFDAGLEESNGCDVVIHSKEAISPPDDSKEEQFKILWVHICTQELKDVAISINKWWKTRYPDFKMRIVSKKEFEHIKMQEQHQQQ